MNTLADQVVEFTVTLVRAFNRTAQFDPASPRFARAQARLFKELGRLQRTQPEIGYVIGAPAVAGGPSDISVDGTSPQRIELRRIVGPSIGGGFVLQLLEFLQQRGLCALGFTRGITDAEWSAFLEIASAPPTEKSPAQEGQRITRALLDKKIAHVSAVCEVEQPPSSPPGGPDLPWQVRTAFARLAHDMRTAVALGLATPAAVLEQSERLTCGMAYSYFRKFDIIRLALFHATAVDQLLQDQPVLRQIRARDLIVRGLPLASLLGTAALILREADSTTEIPAEPAAAVLRAIAERLLKEASSRPVDETLRTLCRRKVLPITRLPVELQEWVLAETWVEAMKTDMAREPPKGGPDSSPVRILQKAARHAFMQHMPVQATGILQRLKSVAPKSLPDVFDMATVEAVLSPFPESTNDRRSVLALLDQGEDKAADSVAAVIVAGEPKVGEAAAWILTEMKSRGTAAALRALDQDIEKEETARLLIACVTGKAAESAADVFIRQFRHKSPRVRRDALTALSSASRVAAENYVAQALADPDESVRIRALLLCANTGVGSAKIIPRAIQLVSRDARGAPPQVVRAAIEVVARRREAGVLPIGDAEAALCRLAAPIGVFGRMFGQKSPPAAVLVTAITALGRLGTERATKLLTRLSRSKDPDVGQAARRELDSKGGRVPLAPLPIVDSSVVCIRTGTTASAASRASGERTLSGARSGERSGATSGATGGERFVSGERRLSGERRVPPEMDSQMGSAGSQASSGGASSKVGKIPQGRPS
jgi:HEAT repeat protein